MGWDQSYYTSSTQKTNPEYGGFTGLKTDMDKYLQSMVGKPLTPYSQPYPTSPLTSTLTNATDKYLQNPANLQREPWATEAIKQMVQTGNPWTEGATTYEALKPIYAREESRKQADLRDQFGAMGGRYSSDLWKQGTDLSRMMSEDLMATLAKQSQSAWEAAQQRKLEALQYTNPAEYINTLTSAGNLGNVLNAPAENAWKAAYDEYVRTQTGYTPLISQYTNVNPTIGETYTPTQSISDLVMKLISGE